MNRPGYPGDSISWEIMESWVDRSHIHQRSGSGLSGWCWSTGGSIVLSGAAICSIAEKFGCSSETLRKWVRRAETD